jgi:NADH-quinone oxidoreductase subunit J
LTLDLVLFYLFAAIAIGASIVVIGQRNPMYSVLSLIAAFICLAGLYVLLDSPFAAVTQIIIYAGAIMVLFLFVVMLLNATQEEPPARRTIPLTIASRPLRVGAILGLVFLVQIVWALARVPSARIADHERIYQNVSSVRQIGIELFTTHSFAFEVTSVLILVAMVGAVALAKRNL